MLDATDDDLMRLAGGGDRGAFTRLVSRHFARAAAFAGRVTGSRSDAEEIVQEAFLRTWLKAPAWQNRDARPGGAQFSTWFYRVLLNLCIDRKRRPIAAPIDAADAVADPAPDGFARTASGEIGRRVNAAIATLPERQRAALVLCHYEGMSNIDAAEVLEIGVGALESLLVRARRSLREILADLAVDTVRKVG
ncbi:MAG: RNA polymerase sigma factor [Proteobacteria bacterium]|nr:RNA polymerase sigma factor [Pseudomonadota bacterium]